MAATWCGCCGESPRKRYAPVAQASSGSELDDGANNTMDVADALAVGGAAKGFGGLGFFQWLLLSATIAMNLSVMSLTLLLSFELEDVAFTFGIDVHAGDSMLFSMLDSAVYFGWLVGATFWGSIADTQGRRFTFIGTLALIGVAGVGCAVVRSMLTLALLRFLLGFAIGGCESAAFVMVSEFSLAESKGRANLIFQCGGSIGVAFLAVGGSLLDQHYSGWRRLEVLVTMPALLLLLVAWLLPETPQFLLSASRPEEAMAVVVRVASINRVSPKSINSGATLTNLEPAAGHGGGCGSLLAPELRCTTVLCWFMWFSCGLLRVPQILQQYYGLTEQAGQQGEGETDGSGRYWSLAVSGLLELPSYVLGFWGMDYVGRRKTVVASLSGVAACAAASLMPVSLGFKTVLAMVSKGLISCAFSCAYTWTSELYPASQRGRAMGTASSAARMGSMLSPVVVVALSEVHKLLPALIFLTLSALTASVLPMLRETYDRGVTVAVQEHTESEAECTDDVVIRAEPDEVDTAEGGSATELPEAKKS